jgi:hypothetical protein
MLNVIIRLIEYVLIYIYQMGENGYNLRGYILYFIYNTFNKIKLITKENEFGR